MSAPLFVSVEEGRAASGLRLILARGVPGPWSIAARAIYDMKRLSYVAVPHDAGLPNDQVRDWTGHVSAPIAMLDDERPRAGWAEILLLAEALQPDPPLIPHDPEDRMTMFGLSHELCGEDGLGWTIRCLMFAAQRASGNVPYPSLLDKYSSPHIIDHHRRRLNDILGMLARRLDAQADKGSPYLVGNQLSAADIYWTAFSNLLHPMTDAECSMPDFYRNLYRLAEPYLDTALPPVLITHRDHVLDRYLDTPLCL